MGDVLEEQASYVIYAPHNVILWLLGLLQPQCYGALLMDSLFSIINSYFSAVKIGAKDPHSN